MGISRGEGHPKSTRATGPVEIGWIHAGMGTRNPVPVCDAGFMADGWIVKSYIPLLLSALSLGVANFVFPRAGKALGVVNSTVYYYWCAAIMAVFFWIPTHERIHIRFCDLQWPLILAMSMLVSNLAYCYGAARFDTSLPAVIRALSFFATALLAIWVSHEPGLEAKDWLGLLLVALGICLFSLGRLH